MKDTLSSYTSHIVLLWFTFLVGIVYLPSLSNSFVSDDLGVASNIHAWGLPYVFSRLTFLRDLLYVGIYTLADINPWAFRFSTILFHLGNTILSFVIVRRLLNRNVAIVSASLFAVHPIFVESVAWISGGVYPQYSFFFLISFYLYISSSALSPLFFLLACLTLDRATVLVIIFPIYDWCFGNLKARFKQLVPLLVIGAFFSAYILLSDTIGQRLSYVGEHEGTKQTIDNPFIYLPVALSSYFELILWPQKLTIYHTELAFTAVSFALRVMVTLAAFTGSMYLLFHKRKLFFWVAVFLVPLLPFLTPFRISWLIAERYAYFSSLGALVIFSYFFTEIVNKHKKNIFYWILLLFILAALGLRSFVRTLDWKNEGTLWAATAVYSPSSVQNWVNLGVFYSRAGNYTNAQTAFAKALKLNPNFADTYYNMGVMEESLGENEKAWENYQHALKLRPDYPQALERMRSVSQ